MEKWTRGVDLQLSNCICICPWLQSSAVQNISSKVQLKIPHRYKIHMCKCMCVTMFEKSTEGDVDKLKLKSKQLNTTQLKHKTFMVFLNCWNSLITLISRKKVNWVWWWTFNSSIWEAETSKSVGGGQPGLHMQFQVIQSYLVRLCLKEQERKQKQKRLTLQKSTKEVTIKEMAKEKLYHKAKKTKTGSGSRDYELNYYQWWEN